MRFGCLLVGMNGRRCVIYVKPGMKCVVLDVLLVSILVPTTLFNWLIALTFYLLMCSDYFNVYRGCYLNIFCGIFCRCVVLSSVPFMLRALAFHEGLLSRPGSHPSSPIGYRRIAWKWPELVEVWWSGRPPAGHL